MPLNSLPSFSFTVTFAAFSTTCAFVRSIPSSVTINPEPELVGPVCPMNPNPARRPVISMYTTAGAAFSTASAIKLNVADRGGDPESAEFTPSWNFVFAATVRLRLPASSFSLCLDNRYPREKPTANEPNKVQGNRLPISFVSILNLLHRGRISLSFHRCEGHSTSRHLGHLLHILWAAILMKSIRNHSSPERLRQGGPWELRKSLTCSCRSRSLFNLG